MFLLHLNRAITYELICFSATLNPGEAVGNPKPESGNPENGSPVKKKRKKKLKGTGSSNNIIVHFPIGVNFKASGMISYLVVT